MRCDGFTLLELMAVVTVMSMLTVLFWGPEIRARTQEFEQVQVDVMIEEMRRLGSMAQTFTLYNNGDWPDVANSCRGGNRYLTLTVLDADSPLYVGAAAAAKSLPFGIGDDEVAHLGRYYFFCPENPPASGLRPEFLVQVALAEQHNHWVGYIANQLAGAEAIQNSDYAAVKVSWPLLSAIPALSGLLPRDGSRAMTGNLDMGGHAIHDIGDVSLRQGQSLGNVPLLHAVARPGNQVAKPACPDEYVPQIIVAPKEIAHANGQPVTKFKVWAEDQGESWHIKSIVYGISAAADTDNHARVLTTVMVKCAL